MQNAFWAYHDRLYETQADWASLSVEDAKSFFIDQAAALGLDQDQFSADIDSDSISEKINLNIAEALALQMGGTPTIIVDGFIVGGQNLPTDLTGWQLYVDESIAVADLEARQYDAPPPMTIDPDKTYLAEVTMTTGEKFVIELYPKSAPQTVNSFVFLANEGWFDNVMFHRVLPNFVAQTGDPSATGRGGPGYSIPNEIDPNLTHADNGIVAMANSGPDTNGSQWYITLGDASFLDGDYTIFGRVIENFDEVVAQITPRDPSTPNQPEGDYIATIEIIVNE